MAPLLALCTLATMLVVLTARTPVAAEPTIAPASQPIPWYYLALLQSYNTSDCASTGYVDEQMLHSEACLRYLVPHPYQSVSVVCDAWKPDSAWVLFFFNDNACATPVRTLRGGGSQCIDGYRVNCHGPVLGPPRLFPIIERLHNGSACAGQPVATTRYHDGICSPVPPAYGHDLSVLPSCNLPTAKSTWWLMVFLGHNCTGSYVGSIIGHSRDQCRKSILPNLSSQVECRLF